jgi:Zn-dependent protease with chaperone function
MYKIFGSLVLSLCFSIVGTAAAARNIGENRYLQELKVFKKSSEHELMFDEDADAGLASIQKTLEIYKDLSYLQRLARFVFFMFDPVIVTAATMPQLYAYVDCISKNAGIETPTIFITSDKHGFFNAAAAKLFTSSGGIIIGQKMIYETTEVELEAVIAHEIGHIQRNHVNKILALQFGCFFGAKIAIESYQALTNSSNYPYNQNQSWARTWLPIIAFFYGPSFIINKRYEKEADFFAFENGGARGIADLFQYLLDREAKDDRDFDIVYAKLQADKSKIAYSDYLHLMFCYYLNKGGHNFNKFLRYIFHHTPLGAHPSHEERIRAAQDYLVQQSDYCVCK